MIVLTRHQDNVEAINSTLRNAGHAVHCNWIRELNDLGDALAQINAHMLIAFVGPDAADTAKVMTVRKQFGAGVPVLIAREQVDEEIIAAAMQQGARDVVTLKNPVRLQAVVTRELEAHRQARTLNSTLSSAREYRDQLKSFMAGSADAIAHVQEGIVVDANPGLAGAVRLSRRRLDRRHAADGCLRSLRRMPRIKGALVACLQGKWSDHSLRANAVAERRLHASRWKWNCHRPNSTASPRCACASPRKKRDAGNLDEQLTDALEHDAATGTLQRQFFIERLQAVAGPAHQGRRAPAGLDRAGQARRDLRRPRAAARRGIRRPVRRPDQRSRASRAI